MYGFIIGSEVQLTVDAVSDMSGVVTGSKVRAHQNTRRPQQETAREVQKKRELASVMAP